MILHIDVGEAEDVGGSVSVDTVGERVKVGATASLKKGTTRSCWVSSIIIYFAWIPLISISSSKKISISSSKKRLPPTDV